MTRRRLIENSGADSTLSGNGFMGLLMIHCPNTGQALITGTYIDAAAFGSMPVFFRRTYCPHCRADHEWFAKDAWVCGSEFSDAILM